MAFVKKRPFFLLWIAGIGIGSLAGLPLVALLLGSLAYWAAVTGAFPHRFRRIRIPPSGRPQGWGPRSESKIPMIAGGNHKNISIKTQYQIRLSFPRRETDRRIFVPSRAFPQTEDLFPQLFPFSKECRHPLAGGMVIWICTDPPPPA